MARATPNASRGSSARDSRGIVYVEFVFAFMPLLLMFLAICQVSMLTMGRLVVQHAALCGARAAIVVLEDDPKDYADAPRGNLKDRPPTSAGMDAILEKVGVSLPSGLGLGEKREDRSEDQRGARMVSIRAAATMPLLLLAPNETAVTVIGADSLGGSLPSDFVSRLPFSLEYTSLAAAITVHTSAGTEELAPDPISRDAQVTVRVSYLMPCGVPVVSALMCRTLAALLDPPNETSSQAGKATAPTESPVARRLRHANGVSALRDLVSPSARFVVLTAETTLPNQGAAYEHGNGS
ncbi:MAG TPA: TadE/TadG family type IV pilus assembly protein [Polyangiaceae bacterium]|nr:TadE/TadG family type IV pilus assembly protein [Polyangiaceae bacterium]